MFCYHVCQSMLHAFVHSVFCRSSQGRGPVQEHRTVLPRLCHMRIAACYPISRIRSVLQSDVLCMRSLLIFLKDLIPHGFVCVRSERTDKDTTGTSVAPYNRAQMDQTCVRHEPAQKQHGQHSIKAIQRRGATQRNITVPCPNLHMSTCIHNPTQSPPAMFGVQPPLRARSVAYMLRFRSQAGKAAQKRTKAMLRVPTRPAAKKGSTVVDR